MYLMKLWVSTLYRVSGVLISAQLSNIAHPVTRSSTLPGSSRGSSSFITISMREWLLVGHFWSLP